MNEWISAQLRSVLRATDRQRARSMRTSWLHPLSLGKPLRPPSGAIAALHFPIVADDTDEAILAALCETPFAPVHQFSRLTHLSPATVHRWLTQSLGFTAHHFRCVRHILSDMWKAHGVDSAQLLLWSLQPQQDGEWHDVVTFGESWFTFAISHECTSPPQGENVPEREWSMVRSEKFMLTIVWNSQRFHSVSVLPEGVIELLSRLSEWRSAQARATGRKLLGHADNAHPYIPGVDGFPPRE
jgi:hypothetical protein